MFAPFCNKFGWFMTIIGESVNRTIGELVNRLKFNRFKRVAV